MATSNSHQNHKRIARSSLHGDDDTNSLIAFDLLVSLWIYALSRGTIESTRCQVCGEKRS